MNNDLATLAALGVTTTRFSSVQLHVNSGLNQQQGLPIGQGTCKAVVLHVNQYLADTIDAQALYDQPAYLCYGDARQQTYQLEFIGHAREPNAGVDYYVALSNNKSDLIICQDLNEVWVRLGQGDWASDGLTVEITIYE